MNIAFISREMAGLDKNGGIGTATRHICEHLAHGGQHEIHCYHTGNAGRDRRGFEQTMRSSGIRMRHINADANTAGGYARRPYQIYETLRSTQHDVYVFHDFMADGFFCLPAKKYGKAFAHAKLGIITHGPSLWVDEGNGLVSVSPARLSLYDMERLCCELADFLVSPSDYLLDWMRERGYRLPERSVRIPNFTSPPDALDAVPARGRLAPADIHELVFFGRLEERKGIRVFCDALNRLSPELLAGREVSFLGQQAHYDAATIRAWLRPALDKAEFAVRFFSDFSTTQARGYLRRPGRLAVMPSLRENSPCVVSECLENGIPFLASDSGGGKELIQEDDRAKAVVAPQGHALAERLEKVLEDEGIVIPRPSYTYSGILENWQTLLKNAGQTEASRGDSPPPDATLLFDLYTRHVARRPRQVLRGLLKMWLKDFAGRVFGLIPSERLRQRCLVTARSIKRRYF
jgi:glycosyltransferase involved in cell wall biosynthesis